jgi:membrane-bound lytic murein transglycosylase D
VDWWYDERRDIIASTYAASNYLKDLYTLWNDWFLAFAAYNCGEGRVARAVETQKTRDFWALNLPKQTERYVPKFLAALYIVNNPAAYGFTIPQVEPLTFDQVTVKDATDLKLIAEFCGTSAEHVAELNPSFLRWCTPPEMEVAVKVPVGRAEECARRLDAVPIEERVTWRKHQVRSGETLSGIASRYNTSVAALKSLNKIKNERRIRAGSYVIVPVQGAWAEVASSKPQYRETRRQIDKAALERYARQAPQPSTPANHKRIVYVVKKNDTLGEIAEAHHTSAAKLRRWNNLAYRSYIHPGQKLVIYVPEPNGASGAATAAPAADSSTSTAKQKYTVKKGDTFYSISKKFNVELSDLLAWNGKSSRSLIYPGDVLVIRETKAD